MKQILGAILVLAIAFGVVRPMLRGFVSADPVVAGQYLPRGDASGGAGATQLAAGGHALSDTSYDEKVTAAKNITGSDPVRVAQVVKQWVSADA